MSSLAQQDNSVDSFRDELLKILPVYDLISDALEGEHAVKSKNVKYLPLPSDCNGQVSNPRYQAYLTRAVYYNVTAPTRDALVGQLFLREPVIELPSQLDSIVENANGEGLSLPLLVHKAANHVLPYGRGGFLTDFPKTNRELTLADIESGEFNSFIQFYSPWTIVNWQFSKVGVRKKLTFLNLKEAYETLEKDAFNVETKSQNRIYRLKNGKCHVSIHREKEPVEEYYIKGKSGEPLNYIPFQFVGSENNDSDIDSPPFYPLAGLNIAHYRNSADYEESVFLVGQPTPVYSGLTEDWVNNYFKAGVPFGSRASIPLPQGADAKLLQALPNMLAFEAMKHKEHQMIAIGAKILNTKSTVERKEAEIEIEAAGQRSVLMNIRNNLQSAIVESLKTACQFTGADPSQIKIALNDNFDLTSIKAEELRYLTELYASDRPSITFEEFRENLRRAGIAKVTDDEARKGIVEDQKLKLATAPPEPTPVVGTKSKTATKKKVPK